MRVVLEKGMKMLLKLIEAKMLSLKTMQMILEDQVEMKYL